MQTKNNLKTILQAIKEYYGLKEIRPSDHVLENDFNGMTYNRFMQIVDTRGKKDLAINEKESIDAWISTLIGSKFDMVNDSFEDAFKVLRGFERTELQ